MKQIFKKFFSKKRNPLDSARIKDFISVFISSKKDYSLFQKFTSFVLISFLLFNVGFRVPFIQFFNYKVNAENKEFYNLVSVIVDNEIYGDIKSKLTRYARDIEGVLDNTKVVIIPTPKDASSFQIAFLLESLYFDGYKSVKNVDFESKLIGSVFVGDISLPLVKDGEKFSKTILPYTDFEEKTYIYNHNTDSYEKSENGSLDIKPEIWQGLISPNTGNKNNDIQEIKDYFDKNHDYYIGEGLFNKDLGVLSGNKDDEIPTDYDPYVFYFDQFREEQSINYTNYKGYQARQENLEDLEYNRFSKELATKIKNQILSGQDEQLQDLIKQAFPDLVLTGSTNSGSLFENTSDISTRYATNNLVKRFIEIFNSSTLAEMRQNVFNAGRYSQKYDKVNADLIPFLVSVIDLISEEVIKNANDDLETSIDNLVINGLSRKIPVFESVKNNSLCEGYTYTNYFYGKKASDLIDASDCSIYRGSLTNSGTLVEANRGYNVNNIESDTNVISSQVCRSSIRSCGSNMSCITRGFWSGNSPINLNIGSSTNSVNFELNSHNLSGAIVPLFDVGGSKRELDSTKTNSPLDCFKGVGIKTEEFGYAGESCDKTYSIDEHIGWQCNTDNLAKGTVNYNDLDSVLKSLNGVSCPIQSILIDGKLEKQSGFLGDECLELEEYNYKTIPSHIIHKSPNEDDLKTEINSMVTPALPIDKDRYIDFIGADGNYKKINYPYLFRLNIGTGLKISLENVGSLLDSSLTGKSAEINSLIDSSKPSASDIIYNKYLKTGSYPEADFDLLKSLKDKPLKTYTLNGDEKTVSYYDSLVFSLYWKNLNSVSAKYKFIFENYLSDQFNGNTYKFGLPKNKKMYEVAYLGAPGDSQNMYVKVDPESRNDNPYANIMSQNATLNNLLLGLNVGEGEDNNKLFKCGPPDGVPIWQWIPAIMCRLKSMLPPTIKIGGGECSNKSLFLSEDEQDKINECDGDVDKNGINDCLESELGGGDLDLTSDSSRYYYNKFGKLNVQLVDKDGNQIRYDNATVVNFELEKLESIDDGIIYEKGISNEDGRKEAEKYFSFKDSYVKVSAGSADYAFSSKSKDVNAYIKAYINVVDFNKQNQIKLEKTIKIEVRGDNFFASAYNINNDNNTLNIDSGSNGVVVSGSPNIFLLDGYTNTINEVKNNINNASNASEKLVFVMENYSKTGKKLLLNYPIEYTLYDSDGKSFSSGTINNSSSVITLSSISKSGEYTLEINDKFGFRFEKNFIVRPEKANSAEITLGTSILETGNVLTTHFLTIYDKFKNPVSGEFYNIEGNIAGDGLLFDENSKDKIVFQTVEGFKAFRLRSTNSEGNNTISFKVKDASGNEITKVTKNIKTLSNVSLAVTPLQTSIKVGGGEYGFNFSVRDKNGSIINDFNSRLYLTLNSIYGTPKESYVDVKNGIGTVKFTTKKTAAKDVKLSFQIEGLKKIYTKYVYILPDDPIRIDLSLTRDKIEASESDYTYLKAELKDRYGNLVFSNNSVNLSLEIKDQYKGIINPEIYSSLITAGVASFKIKATDNPGIAYIKVKASPEFKTILELEGQSPFTKSSLNISSLKNSDGLTDLGKKFFEEYDINYYKSKFYTLEDLKNSQDFSSLLKQDQIKLITLWLQTNKITINPQSENAIKLETYYFWNKEAISGNSYNSLYTVLLGAPYGDITQKDYLASAMLFDKDNRSLAVTSILNDPYKHNDVISISGNGAISSIKDSQNITQDIKYIANSDRDNKLYFDIYNEALSIYIGKVYYNLDDNNDIKVCTGDNLDFSDCNTNNSKTSILLKDLGSKYNAYEDSGTLVLKDNLGNLVFKINRDGTIRKNTNLTIENYTLNDTKSAVFSIKEGNDIIGLFSYNLVNTNLNVTRDEGILTQKLTSLKNSIIIYLNSYLYGDRSIDTNENNMLMIYYNDPFNDASTLDSFSDDSSSSIESFKENKGVGWEGKNKSMLLFASGESVGESTKKYSSFSLINLGDPVLNLKGIKKKLPGTEVDRSFDSTVGKLISKDSKNVGYKVFDYNNDNQDDLILVKSNSFIELLENRGDFNFENKGNLVYLPELGNKGIVEAGDFTGDSYGDIFYIAKGKPYLLNNVEKKFTKISLEEQFLLSGSIVRTSSFDMDNDGKKDIVTLDTTGDINIFYGGGSDKFPIFTKKKVGDGYILKLDSEIKDANGAVYYNGLPTLDNDQTLQDMILSNEDLIKELQNAGTGTSDSFEIDERLIDNVLFVKLPYSSGAINVASGAVTFTSGTINDFNIPLPNNDELGSFDVDTINGLNDLTNYSSDNIYYYPDTSNNSQNTTFVKSEYSNNFGIKVEKTFTDVNGGSLNSGDIVNVEVKLKNTSNSTKRNIAYAENIEDYFYFSQSGDNVQTSKESNIRYNIGTYDFLVDNFLLNPNDEFILNYQVETLPLTYGYIETGLFEKGEAGDDVCGDIILKPDDKSCALDVDLYRSVGTGNSCNRSYDKGKTESTCDLDKLKLPGDLELNKIDENGNGVPDYIDNLVLSANSDDKTDIKDYSQDALNGILKDTDSDGIPDDEDPTPGYNNNNQDTGNFLDTINDTTDQILDGLDFISQGLCKGFGGGSCVSSPLNAAPLAPGSSLTAFGFPIAPAYPSQYGVTTSGIPVFSAVTHCPPYAFTRPPCPVGAGGIFGYAPGPFRLFVTPTLTGGVGVAACFSDNMATPYGKTPMGVYPFLIQGGNCVVAAKPLVGCAGDGSDGDPKQKNNPINFGNYDILNGSCIDNTSKYSQSYFRFDSDFVTNYLKYKNGDHSSSVIGAIKDSFSSIASNSSRQIANMPANPLITIGDGNEAGAGSFSIDIDTNALKNGNLKDVVKIQNTWITDFPAFLMDWVDRQIEEIVTKLTSFPSIIVILPDFDGVLNSDWFNVENGKGFFDKVKDSFEEGKKVGAEKDKVVQTKLDSVNNDRVSKKCADKTPSDDGYFDCLVLDLKSQNLGLQKDYNPTQTISGIKSVYEFIGNLPLISIQEQSVTVNIPWITETSLLKAKVTWETAKKQRQDEINRAAESWSLGQACNGDIECQKRNEIGNKIILDANGLLNSLDKNLDTIEDYKKLPEKLMGLLNKKEDRLQQILCNVDALTSLFGGWLGANGERFKAWVQAYILIKAVLKSWQLLIDLFNDYEVSCKQCKNERQDLMTFMWKLISMVVPKIPVIQFPKWPNIILDLHNVKAGLIISMPDFKFNVRPIIIPELPKLYLPKVPDVNIVLPTLPILEPIDLPELPDLPTLPKIELPDLPPPPKLPKLLGSIEGVLNILKIITKVQCILKFNPLVPEWRAGDQISYITERQGFLPTDFIDISLPQFSFPFVDAIKITTYVNFELETDFVTEMARQGVAPLNTFTNNIVNLFRMKVPDLDFSSPVQERIDINLGNQTGMNKTLQNDKEIVEGQLNNFTKFVAYSMFKILKYMKDNKDVELSNKDFLAYVNENLASEEIQRDAKAESLRRLWQDVSNMTYSKEDKLINDLKNKSKDKFDALKDIVNTEIQRTKMQKESIKSLNKPNSIKLVSSSNDSNIDAYNEIMRKHNLETVKATMNLLADQDNDKKDLQIDGNNLLNRVKGGLSDFKKTLAANTSGTGTTSEGSTCSSDPNYKFSYKGIYVLENGISYRLFDYIDELKGNEKLSHSDVDNDGDEDLFYMVNGELFLKENTKNDDANTNTIYDPYELNVSDNKFYNGSTFYEAVNNSKETTSSNGYINFSFDAPLRDDLNNFRLVFYSIVDKFLNEGNDTYIPQNTRKEIVDSFADTESISNNRYTLDYDIKNNLAYIRGVGNNINDDIILETKEMINIKNDLASGRIVSLSSNTKLYAGKTPFTITYYVDNPNLLTDVTVNSNENIQFKSGAKVSSLTGNAYIEGKNKISVSGQNIKNYLGLPILPGTKILDQNDDISRLTESSHIDINYYDGTETSIDFRDAKSYRLYDLGFKSDNYLITLKQENDFYYSKVNAFKDNIDGTISSQVLLSPQLSSDKNTPEINLNGNIKIPVYQKFTYDFTSYIYEDSGIGGIADFYIDQNLDEDSNGDGDKKNDRDMDNLEIKKTFNSVKVDFGPYQELFTKKIGLHIEDLAGNYAYKEANLEVYSPIPAIDSKESDNIIGSIDEKLLNEPINLYRFRDGTLSKLVDKGNNQKVNTNSNGAYDFETSSSSQSGLVIKRNSNTIANIDEHTGKITISSLAGTQINVIPSNSNSNDLGFVKIVIKSGANEVYYEYFSFDKVQSISVVDDFNNINSDGVHLKLDNKSVYSHYQIPLSATYNPGAIVIYSIGDTYKTPLFTIFTDGRINVYSDYYTLEYENIGDNVGFKLLDINRNKQVGEVLMKMSKGNYIVK